MFIDKNQKRVNLDAPYVDLHGNRHGNLRDQALRVELEITEIPDPQREDEFYYFVQEVDEDPYVVNTPKTLGLIRVAIENRIDGSCENAMASLRAGYPESEVLSWSKQESEARAFVSDPNAATPLLDALATARDIDKTELVNRVIAKADLFANLSGQIIGTRQALQDALSALPDEATIETHAAELAALEWPL